MITNNQFPCDSPASCLNSNQNPKENKNVSFYNKNIFDITNISIQIMEMELKNNIKFVELQKDFLKLSQKIDLLNEKIENQSKQINLLFEKKIRSDFKQKITDLIYQKVQKHQK